MSVVWQERVEEARGGAGISPEGRRLVRDRLQIRQGKEEESRREGLRQEGRGREQARGEGCQERHQARAQECQGRRQAETACEEETTMSPAAARPRSLRRYLVAGVLVWLPILAVVWVVRFLVQLMDQTLLLLPASFRPEALFGFALPGLGAVLAFLIVLVTGLLVTNLIGRQLVGYWEDLMQRIPLVRSVYGGVRSFTESVLSSSNSFRQVVAVEYPRPGIWSIGFVTADNVAEVSNRTGEQLTCVFVSTAPNPTSGFIILVPKRQLIALEMSVDAAMKMIVTCGVVLPEPPVAHLPVRP